MTSHLFNDSSSSSEHINYNYVTPVRKNPVYRKINMDKNFNEVIDVDTYEYVAKKKLNISSDECDDDIEVEEHVNIGQKKFGYNFENMNDDDISFEKSNHVEDDVNIGQEKIRI